MIGCIASFKGQLPREFEVHACSLHVHGFGSTMCYVVTTYMYVCCYCSLLVVNFVAIVKMISE